MIEDDKLKNAKLLPHYEGAGYDSSPDRRLSRNKRSLSVPHRSADFMNRESSNTRNPSAFHYKSNSAIEQMRAAREKR